MDPYTQRQEQEKRMKRAVVKVKAYTICTQFVMFIYAGFFIYSLASSPFTLSTFISFFLNFTIVMTCASGCGDTRRKLSKNPPAYTAAKLNVQVAICMLVTYVILYGLAALAIYFILNGKNAIPSLVVFSFASPCLLLALIGYCVIKNFNTLLAGASINQAQVPEAQQTTINVSGFVPYTPHHYSINNQESSMSGYAKAPEPFEQQGGGNQALAKSSVMNYPYQ